MFGNSHVVSDSVFARCVNSEATL